MRLSVRLAALFLLPVSAAAAASASGVGRWDRRAPMLTERTEVAGAALDDRIYIAGGLGPGGATDAVEEYDVSADTWRTRAPLPARLHHAAVVVGSRLYVVGGFDPAWRPVVSVFEYDPGRDRWARRTPMSAARDHLGGGERRGEDLRLRRTRGRAQPSDQ
ncbi:MAG: kelch repeat-containing protein [Armatimonadota bacterium]|nr:kelch repeat-containing protein [Armatimonadota bacterium]MDR7588938.1 kelch repeat-containing protein [Armatimonadota bacterium]MDR7612181.1 kelch repeat-containing protein [Armatimonadota bacterium]